MVHTKSTIAVAVLALSAATALAAPSYEFSDEIAARDFDDFELEARDFDFDVEARDFDNELDARDIFDFEDFEARDVGDDFELQEARDFLEDVEAREFDFGDVQEREFYDFEDVVERAPAPSSTSTSSSSTTTPSATTTTHVVKPTGKAKKETKTVVVTTHALPKKCAKPSAMQRLKNFFRKKRASRRKRSQLRAKRRAERKARRNGKATSTTSTSTTSTSTSTSATSTATAATKTLGSEWAQITPPPRKNIPKGVRYTQKRNVGKDKVTTISRTVTAAPTPCPTKAKDGKKRFKREVEDFEDILGRSYEFDELD